MVKREKSNYLIQSVSHCFDVLEQIAKAGGEIGVTQLSKLLKLHKNNVFRLLATLELRGYVEQNPATEDYRLGVKNLEMGQAYLTSSPLVTRAQPILRALSEEIGETVSLATIYNGVVQFPLSFSSKRSVRVAPRTGISFSAKANAAGRLLTAFLPDNLLNEVLAGDTPHDVAIRNQLGELRSSGQILDKGGIEADVVAICRVVRGFNSDAVGAIEVLVPQYRAKLEAISPAIDEAAATLSQALGSYRASLAASIEKEVVVPAEAATSQASASVVSMASRLRERSV